jgi:hypothetical protein
MHVNRFPKRENPAGHEGRRRDRSEGNKFGIHQRKLKENPAIRAGG